jgi:predicted enzyme related to lactoylglutathione lyase
MTISLQYTYVTVSDVDEALAFYRDALGLAVQKDVSAGGHRWVTLGSDAQRVYDTGKAVKQAAYDIQKQPWSKSDVPARDVRLANAKSISAAAMTGDVTETARLQQASSG